MKDAFDVDFYLGRYPDIALSQIDPLWHFAQAGWHEGRDPSPAFSVKYYLEANPDVQAQNLNPFWHYVVSGKAEGRLARHPGGYRADLLRRTLPLKDRSIEWRTSAPPETVMSAADVIEVLRSATWSETVGLMISIAHDNYRAGAGGVQFCIQHEEQTARSRGVLYLNLYPLQPLPCLADMDETPDVLVSLLLSGVPIGVAPMSAVIAAVRARAGGFRTTEVVVHHLLGHSPEQVADLVRAAGGTQCWLWLHDFFTLCPSYALQRNDVSFCGAPPPGSNACRLCLYGPERDRHRARMARFFDGLSVQVIAPSRFAADFWQDRADLTPASITVKDHMAVERRPRAQWTPDRNEPISVAFIGYPAPHKGWSVFEKLVRDTGGSNAGFRFLYFGISEIGLSGVDRISVRVTAEDPDAMTRAIAAQSVDLVLHWASWPETFSFSTHEAMAAGAFVLTNTISGNVAATVQNLEMGVVLKDEAELLSFFRDGRVRQLAERVRRIRRIQEITLRRSDMTFSVLDEVRGT
jgi:hypothetical protein